MVLNGYAIHPVTMELALEGFGTKLTSEKLEDWANRLEEVAKLMRSDAKKLKPRRKKS